jgi:hypothetical protein
MDGGRLVGRKRWRLARGPNDEVVWVDLYPVSLPSPLTCGVFFVTALAVSSVGHFYDNYYRTRLGARDKSAEVDDR